MGDAHNFLEKTVHLSRGLSQICVLWQEGSHQGAMQEQKQVRGHRGGGGARDPWPQDPELNELNARALKVGACPVCNYTPYYQPKAAPIMGYDVPSDILFCCPTFSKKCLDNWVLDVEKHQGCIS